ncbi:class I SAM-dependent rRNA methyltransferase [Patescibacteria group bacterium]|jgi:23S rRNA (cytosine1962-C5)-methyltransferase|nr:class I SAM-dependent rRNA methyltransferase [Patescibacteria group bacterium]
MHPSVILKPGKDIPLRAGHPWVFSNAIDTIEGKPGAGDLVIVRSQAGEAVGLGTWNGLNSIRVRILDRDANRLIDANYFAERFAELDEWKRSHLPEATDGYRVVHAEADGLPGLIVDRYADVLVFQIHTVGMDRFRGEIVEALVTTFKPKAVVERSDVEARNREGLMPLPPNIHHGVVTDAVPFKEYGITFLADVINGQKTGFFLDQREARRAVGNMSKGKRVLNLFGYSGAFSLHAAKGGAEFVATVDVSRPALELAERQFTQNGFDPADESKFLFLEADVLDLLARTDIEGGPYDVIICDPPAFAKTDAQVEKALKAYAEVNAACLRALAPSGTLVTSSCSGRVTNEDFRNILKLAAGRAKREVRLLDYLEQPFDHAERLAFPEGRYLKTAILEVTKTLG